jgi:hypothetical protein
MRLAGCRMMPRPWWVARSRGEWLRRHTQVTPLRGHRGEQCPQKRHTVLCAIALLRPWGRIGQMLVAV